MPKKKGKGNKLARMSDEERARYLQHRAELELEAKRRKQQLIAAFTKVHQTPNYNNVILQWVNFKNVEQAEARGSVLTIEHREDQRTMAIYSAPNKVQRTSRRRGISLAKFWSHDEDERLHNTAIV